VVALLGVVARDERGVSLTEVLMAATLGIVVLGVPLTLLVQVFVMQNTASSRSATTNRVELGVNQLTRDLRHATAATISSASGTVTAALSVPTPSSTGGVTPAALSVTWTCTAGGACTRQIGDASVAAVIPYVVSASFVAVSRTGATTLPQTNPSYVSVTVSALVSSEQGDHSRAAGATHPLTVHDGVALRNFS
jgi:uncharacterized membrane protein